jgi:hypothetical protein
MITGQTRVHGEGREGEGVFGINPDVLKMMIANSNACVGQWQTAPGTDQCACLI